MKQNNQRKRKRKAEGIQIFIQWEEKKRENMLNIKKIKGDDSLKDTILLKLLVFKP